MADESTILSQIEATADFNPPGTYAFSPTTFLTYYNDLTIAQDSLASQFVSLSAVAQRAINPKLFAIGVIPPSINLSGKLLDRSSTINSITGEVPTYVPTAGGQSADRSAYVKSLLEWACNPPNGRNENDPIYQTVVEGRDIGPAQKSYSSCGDLPNWMLYSLGVRTDYVNRAENNSYKTGANINKLAFSPVSTAVNSNTQYKPGDTLVIYNKPDGTDAHALVVIGQENGKLITGEYGQPGGGIFQRNITLKDGVPFMGNRQVQRILPLDAVLADAQAKGQLTDVRLPNDIQSNVNSDTANNTWNGDLADAARKQQEKLANTPLTADQAGQAFIAAQQAQYLAVKQALDAMANSPPLRMLVNPKAFSVKGEKIASDGNWGRNGPIIEHWGDNQEKISASGRVAGFYAIDANNAGGPGLTRMARNYSQAWQNFQSMYLFYKNNGALYTKDFASSENNLNLTLVGSIYIYYDSILYIGSFDSFSISESDTAPFSVDYSFDFTVRSAFLLDQPNTLDYGANTIPNSSSLIQTNSSIPVGTATLQGSSNLTGPF